MNQEEYLKTLSNMVYEMEDEAIAGVVEDYLAAGYDAMEAIDQGLIPGMDRAGTAFAEEEYFVTDLLFAADAMYTALDILQPYLHQETDQDLGTIVLGDVEGDTHDIGKNLVKMMLETAGFKVIDLGKDVPVQQFVEAALASNAQMIAMSSLMSTTMENMRRVIEILEEEGIRDRFKVMIGGGPVTLTFAQEIGADGYADNAAEAVQIAKNLLKVESR